MAKKEITEEVTEKDDSRVMAEIKELTPEEKAAKIKAHMEEKIPYVFRSYAGMDENETHIYIAVNGRNFVIELDKEVKVPRFVIEVYENMRAQAKIIQKLKDENKRKLEQMEKL